MKSLGTAALGIVVEKPMIDVYAQWIAHTCAITQI